MRTIGLKLVASVCISCICTPTFAWTNIYSVKISGGYGLYQDVYRNDGATGIIRVAVADQIPVTNLFMAGAELGIQTGSRMRLTDATVAPLVYVTLPIFITITPPIDLLLTAERKFTSSLSLFGKLGVSYFNMMCDSQTIKSNAFFEPELQIGAGYQLTEKAKIEIAYQRIGGGRLVLHNVNVNDGTASLDVPPILQAMFLSVTMNLS
jgi:hypothetical protein